MDYTAKEVRAYAAVCAGCTAQDMLNAYANSLDRRAEGVTAEQAQPADSKRGDADHARDLRHLIYLDTQFNWRGETDLKLPEMHALEARGWIAEAAENGEFEITDAGREAIEAALAAQGQGDAWRQTVEFARDQLINHVQMCSPECTCEPCPECGKQPSDCSGTACAQTCQCSACDYCQARDAAAGLTRLLSAPPAPPARLPEGLLGWAVDRWRAEVQQRPLANVHRRSLDDVWRQVIRYAGGDDVMICGPRHDDLLAASQEQPNG